MRPVHLLVIQNDSTDPPARLGRWLTDAGATLHLVQAHLGEPVPTRVPEGVDGVVPLGGAMDCDDDDAYPFLVDERALLRDAVGSGTPVFAVCLGAQLLAYALGGTVSRAAPGEIGLARIAPTPEAAGDPLARHLTAATPVAQYHQDEVAALPDGAVLLAENPACRHQMWRLGDRAWAVQGHPEVDGTIMADWVQDDPDLLRRCGTTRSEAGAAVLAAEDEIAAVWQPVAAAFVRASGS